MPLYDFFRNIFNIPSKNEDLNENQYNRSSDVPREKQDFWGANSNSNDEMWRDIYDRKDEDNIRNFNVFTDPLEMQRYFEHQMDEMLKSFGGFFGPGNSGFFGFNDQIPSLAPPESQFPAIEQPPQHGNLRERLLKPGFENHDSKVMRRDQVIDDRVINAGDLDELLKDRSPACRKPIEDDGVVTSYQHKLPQIRSFGQSMSSKIVRRPDGTVETHKTVRDSAGNEETVVTRQMGDKQYTMTIRTDREGRHEKCEELINMDEQELPKFKDYWKQSDTLRNDTVDDLNKLFPFFDKFFK